MEKCAVPTLTLSLRSFSTFQVFPHSFDRLGAYSVAHSLNVTHVVRCRFDVAYPVPLLSLSLPRYESAITTLSFLLF